MSSPSGHLSRSEMGFLFFIVGFGFGFAVCCLLSTCKKRNKTVSVEIKAGEPEEQ